MLSSGQGVLLLLGCGQLLDSQVVGSLEQLDKQCTGKCQTPQRDYTRRESVLANLKNNTIRKCRMSVGGMYLCTEMPT